MIFTENCPKQRSTSTTTTQLTALHKSHANTGQPLNSNRVKAKATSAVKCSVISKRIATLWLMETTPIRRSRRALCEPILAGEADMTVGDRLSNGTYAEENKRAFHGFGNNLVRSMIKWIYGYSFDDVMTGYRAMSKPFVKTFPVLSEGFQIETELSIHAVDHRWRIKDVPIEYRDRPAGSESKLNTVSDGIRVIAMIGTLFKDYRPLKFFSLVALAFAFIGLALGTPIVTEYFATGLVPRFPTAMLAAAFMFLCGLSLATGFILDSVAKVERKQWELRVYEETESRS